MRVLIAIGLLPALLGSCPSSAQDGYKLSKPDKRYELPDRLTEISGLTYLGSKEIACIQDEKGNLYRFDLKKEDADKWCDFGEDGDYEALEYVDGIAYVLRSDGALYRISNPGSESESVEYQKSPIKKGYDLEGLGYDPAENRLLIATKSLPGEAGAKMDDEGIREIFAYDLQEQEWVEKPALRIDLGKINRALEKRGNKDIKFRPSALAVHPITNEFYILSSVGNQLLVFDRKGRLSEQHNLKKELFRQPEGICFDSDGDLYISNEGRSKKAYILRFEYRED